MFLRSVRIARDLTLSSKAVRWTELRRGDVVYVDCAGYSFGIYMLLGHRGDYTTWLDLDNQRTVEYWTGLSLIGDHWTVV